MQHRPDLSRRAGLCALAASALVLATPAAQAGSVDIQATDIDVVQVLHDTPNQLIGNRATMIRASITLANDPGPVALDGVLRVYVDGVEAADSPIYSNNGGPYNAQATPNINQVGGTLNFNYIPPVSDDVVFEVEVNPPGPQFVPESDLSNNKIATPSLEFRLRATPTMMYAPIDYRPGGGGGPNLPDTALIEPGAGDNFVQGIFPGPDIIYRRINAPSKLWTGSLSSSGSSLNNSLTVDANTTVPPPNYIYGWVPGSLPYNGMAFINGKASMGNTEPVRHQRTYAHELGHNFGLGHNGNNIGAVGIDVEAHLKIPLNLPTLKSTGMNDIMVAGQITSSAWVRGNNFTHFFNHSTFANTDSDSDFSDIAPASGPATLICGLLDRAERVISLTDTVELDGDREYTAGVPAPLADLMVRVFAGGELVHELPLAIQDSADRCDECRGDSDSEASLPVVGFHATIPSTYDGLPIERLEISHRGVLDAATTLRVQRSAAAPEVAFQPLANQDLTAGPLTIRWNATDADGDALVSYLRYSPDGEQFVPLVSSLPVDSLDVDMAELPRLVPGQGFFEVTVSDGLHNTRVRTEPLAPAESFAAAGSAPPFVHMMSPDDGQGSRFGRTVFLHAAAWDPEDFALFGGDVVWTSDLDGVIGTGRLTSTASLSVGVHTLTVTGTDSDGQMTSDTATFTVVDRELPDVDGDICQTDLGFAGPGTALLEVCGGNLATGNPADMSLSGAPPFAVANLVLSLSSSPTPLKGGTLVPFPILLLTPLSTDGSGELSFPIPGGLGPATLYAQYLVADGAQVQGLAFSNAVEILLLP